MTVEHGRVEVDTAIYDRLAESRDRWAKLRDRIEAGEFDDLFPDMGDGEAILNAAFERCCDHVRELDQTLMGSGRDGYVPA